MESELEQAILIELNKTKLTFNKIVTCTDKGKLLNFIDIINTSIKNFKIHFSLKNFLLNEFLLLEHNNIKLLITPFYLQVITQN